MPKDLKGPDRGSSTIRIGAAIGPHDPYWVQVRETIYKRMEEQGVNLVPLEISDTNDGLYALDAESLAEELLAQDLDAMVCQSMPLGAIYQLVYNNMAVIMLGESQLRHRLFSSPTGLYDVGCMAASYVASKIGRRGRILCVGGLLDHGEDKGVSRISGFCDRLRQYPDISVLHCPTAWRYDQAYPLVYNTLRELGTPVDAIYGISDSLALAGRDAAHATGMVTPQTVIIGINGDPQALAAVMEGSMSATIDTSSEELGNTAVDIAIQWTQGKPLPPHFPYTVNMVTAENVTQFAAQKLYAISKLPSRLVGVNREEERHRLAQLETGAAINRNVGLLLDRSRLSKDVIHLLQQSYGFDAVQFFRWSEKEVLLYLEGIDDPRQVAGLPLDEAGLLGEALRRKETIFIPDTRYSKRFLPDPNWPETRSRVVIPVRLGDETLGLLDMHSRRPFFNLRWDIISLQALADQFAIALSNADLYSQAVESREIAERADQLKTRLLANVSHELRTPLNVILGYSQAALTNSNLYGAPLPDGLLQDLHYIYQSGEHLIRIINDLLDLSRAEIGELNVFPEPVEPRPFLKEIFDSMAKMNKRPEPDVRWQLEIPQRLPVIQADPVRLRQILLNLLSNAGKFTTSGQIVMGAEVEPPYLHLWVADSGEGIPIEQQESIFEPFVVVDTASRRREGIGLGLSITRRLVALHGGSMSLESQPGRGSVFHIYWPLPNLSGALSMPQVPGARPALIMVTSRGVVVDMDLPYEIGQIAARQNLEICMVHSVDELEGLLGEKQPVVLAWDMACAAPGEWNIIQRLQRHPQFASVPLILLGQGTGGIPEFGATNVMLKPFSGKKLMDLIDSFRPQEGTGTVLVVDDDDQAAALYRDYVTSALPGHVVVHAADGQQAVQFLQENTPALVILDLVMPRMDGFAVLDALRSDSRTSRVPVIVLSGKLLTLDDVARLNFSHVVFHSKGLLSSEEIVHVLQQTVVGDTKLGQPTSRLVKQALAYMHQNFSRALTRGELAEMVGVSENYLNQIFHHEVGLSPLDCLNRLRILKARERLRSTGDTITQVAASVGIDDPAYFSRVFRKVTGISPQAFRQQP
jgi:signal transduction histidine kinase/AraC-like DNA-binding protein/DNA-binding LacI/PurR family transcriptional regulator